MANPQLLEKAMTKSIRSTKVKALDPLLDASSLDESTLSSHDEPALNPSGRPDSNRTRRVKLSKPSQSYKTGTLNCRTLSTICSRKELNHLVSKHDIKILCVQEHRYVHKPSDPEIVSHDLDNCTLFTSSATRNEQGASIHGVGIVVHSSILPLLTFVDSIDENIMIAVFKGNPKTCVLSCYSPHNSRPEQEVIDFYETLDLITEAIPHHNMLLIQGDFNARLEGKFSFHDDFNRNGKYLREFSEQHNLVVGNITFQKPRKKLWTWRSPRGDLAQIDYCMYRKRWRNSIPNCQAYSSSNPIGSDHRIVSTMIQMSFRTPKPNRSKRLNWQAIRNDIDLGTRIGANIAAKFNALPDMSKNYSEFLKVLYRGDSIASVLRPETTFHARNALVTVE
ncbi:uncharacterized protein [Clytia hemisphaerica]|uniref:uncharacterized protein n=1 Tax=Clytia hemisphaerica TaxID=252671 RepID=UPI0034D61160